MVWVMEVWRGHKNHFASPAPHPNDAGPTRSTESFMASIDSGASARARKQQQLHKSLRYNFFDNHKLATVSMKG